MKKLSVAFGMVAFLGLGVGANLARADYGMAGCGLGSLVMKENSLVMQVLAATTNGTSGSQTFGITSGTSNCVSGGMVKAQREQTAFAEVNFQDLKRNMATGGGEFVVSFASLLGCEDRAKAGFVKMTQDKYETIFTNAKTTPIQMLQTVKSEIKANPALSASCSDERALARAEGKPIQLAKK